MSSTGVNIGVASESRNSSRVLKPPGGGHSDIFGPAEHKTHKPRAKYNQQNSAAMGEIMGKPEGPMNEAEPAPPCEPVKTSEPPKSLEPAKPAEVAKPVETPKPVERSAPEAAKPAESSGRVRVPPGGFSSGLW